MHKYRDVRSAIKDTKSNINSDWNVSTSSSERSSDQNDAANRIFDGYANVRPQYTGQKLTPDSRVFAMGSCFAREIEDALISRGCNVISIDERINIPEFSGPNGLPRSGFFHRFTPRAMLQEFQIAFGEIDGWAEDTLLFDAGDAKVIDVNYWDIPGSDARRESVLTRRRIASQLVRKSAEADIVILTLGLIESWVHKPSGLHANRVPPRILVKHSDEFELRLIDTVDAYNCLVEIRNLLKRHNSNSFQMVVTVSPVPLQKTWTSKDIIIANADSKSTLRAAAFDFCDEFDDVHYFPSYEIVSYSNAELSWRPDRVHVNKGAVNHIVKTFVDEYYEGTF